MKIGLYAAMDNGIVKDHQIDYIAVDEGLAHLHKQGIKPLLAIGDFDSLEDQRLLEDLQVERYPVKKDDTDTALAIRYAISQGYDEIDVYGVLGGRADHMMAALCLLIHYPDVKITLYDQQNKIMFLPKGSHHITVTYDYFSLFAIKETVLSLSHCQYPLDHYLFKPFDPLCVSNTCKDYVHIDNSEAVLFLQTNNEGEAHESFL